MRAYYFSRHAPQPYFTNSAGTVAVSAGNGQNVWTIPADSEASFTCRFRLIDLPNFAEFQALFDRVRLKRIVYTFEYLQVNAENATTALSNLLPKIQYFYDKDVDGSAPVAILDRQGVRTWYAGQNARRVLNVSYKPTVVLTRTDASSGLTFRVPSPSPWIDTTAPVGSPTSIEHIGVSGVITNYASGTIRFFVTGKAYFVAQQVR